MKKGTPARYRRTFAQEVADAIQLIADIQARQSQNDVYAVIAFNEAGYDVDTIYPRETVLTFDAWKAYGRHVTKGAKAVAVPVWKPLRQKTANGWEIVTRTDKATGEQKPQMIQSAAYLFHVSQTSEYAPEEIAKLCKDSRPPAFLPLTQNQRAALAAATVSTPREAEAAPVPVTISYGSTVIHSTEDTPEEIAADARRVAAARDRHAGGNAAPGMLPLFANA